jgi:hypothetical protein
MTRVYTEEQKEKNAAYWRRRMEDPEYRERHNADQRRRREDPAYRAKKNADQRRRREDPEYRERENAAERKRRRREDPAYRAKKNAAQVERIHGLPPGGKQAMYEHQGGLCGLCEEAFLIDETVTDHCHLSDVRRGLLCNSCNVADGYTPKSVEALDAWVARLKLWRSGELRPASILDSI